MARVQPTDMVLPVQEWTLIIDGWRPDARLSLNGRRRTSIWTVRQLQADAKARVGWALREMANTVGPLPSYDQPVMVKFTFGYARRGRRDSDGLSGLVKPCLDALVDEGILKDDDTEHVRLWVTAVAPSPVQTEIRITAAVGEGGAEHERV